MAQEVVTSTYDARCRTCGSFLLRDLAVGDLVGQFPPCAECGDSIPEFTRTSDRAAIDSTESDDDVDEADWDEPVFGNSPGVETDATSVSEDGAFDTSDDFRSVTIVDGVPIEFGLSFRHGAYLDEIQKRYPSRGDFEAWTDKVGAEYASSLKGELDAATRSISVHTQPREPLEMGGPGLSTDTVLLIFGAVMTTLGAYPALKELVRDVRRVVAKLEQVAQSAVEIESGVAVLYAWDSLTEQGIKDGELLLASPLVKHVDWAETYGWLVVIRCGEDMWVVVLNAQGAIQVRSKLPAPALELPELYVMTRES
jgi:hypothetical protein